MHDDVSKQAHHMCWHAGMSSTCSTKAQRLFSHRKRWRWAGTLLVLAAFVYIGIKRRAPQPSSMALSSIPGSLERFQRRPSPPPSPLSLPPALLARKDSDCGPLHHDEVCNCKNNNQYCSKYGWCGDTAEHREPWPANADGKYNCPTTNEMLPSRSPSISAGVGLDCPHSRPLGACDICAVTDNLRTCAEATTSDACADLCRKWNEGALPGVKRQKRNCRSWFFKPQSSNQCILKDCAPAECGEVSGELLVSGTGCFDDASPLCEQYPCQCTGLKLVASATPWHCVRADGATGKTVPSLDSLAARRIAVCQEYARQPTSDATLVGGIIDTELPQLCGVCPSRVDGCLVAADCCSTIIPIVSSGPHGSGDDWGRCLFQLPSRWLWFGGDSNSRFLGEMLMLFLNRTARYEVRLAGPVTQQDAPWHGDSEYLVYDTLEGVVARISRRFWSSAQRSLESIQNPSLVKNRDGVVWNHTLCPVPHGDDTEGRTKCWAKNQSRVADLDQPDGMWLGPSLWFIPSAGTHEENKAVVQAHMERMAQSVLANRPSAHVLFATYPGWVHEAGIPGTSGQTGSDVHDIMMDANQAIARYLSGMPNATRAGDSSPGARGGWVSKYSPSSASSVFAITVLHLDKILGSAIEDCGLPDAASFAGPMLHWTMSFHFSLLDLAFGQFCT